MWNCRFTKNVETTLRELFLVEVIVSTLLMCLLEYYCMVVKMTNYSMSNNELIFEKKHDHYAQKIITKLF